MHHGRARRLADLLVAQAFPFWAMADAVAPALAVGIMFGRIGCFLNGCCYGAVCDLPFPFRCVTPPAPMPGSPRSRPASCLRPPRLSLPVHPTQLYAAGAGLLLLAVLTLSFPAARREGSVMVLLMVLYPLTRWPIEMLRGDEQALFAGMTLSQSISLGLLIWESRSG